MRGGLGLLGVALLAACAAAAPRSDAQLAADAATAARVEGALTASPTLFARHIDVAVDRGVVHLDGYVWESEDLYLARNIAAAVPGVRSVSSQLALLRGGAKGR